MQANYLLIIFLISTHALAVEEDTPSLDFLEYLGELETEIDGELVSPVELELIAENTDGEEIEHE